MRARSAFAVLAAACAVAVAACGDDDGGSGDGGAAVKDNPAKGKEVCLIVFDQANPYQQAHAKQTVAYGKTLGLDVQVLNGKLDAQVQANLISDCVSKGVDGIMIQPVNPDAVVGPIKEAQGADIPVVTYIINHGEGVNTPFLFLNEQKTTFQAGADAAKAVKRDFPGQPPKMVILDILTLPLCKQYRMDGFIAGVKSVDPDAELVARVDAKGDRQTGRNVMEDLIQKDPDFNIFATCNGEMTLGGIAALEAAGRGKAKDKKPETEYIFGIDGSPEMIEKLLDPSSSLEQVMDLRPKQNAQETIGLLTRVWKGEIEADQDVQTEVTSDILTPDCERLNELQREQWLSEGVPCPE